jgi:chemotaxis-related protein WspD
VERDKDRWVFLVDEIHGIHHFHPKALQPVPVTATTATPLLWPAATTGVIDWQDTGVGYLDPELVFSALHREIL